MGPNIAVGVKPAIGTPSQNIVAGHTQIRYLWLIINCDEILVEIR